VFSIGKTLYVAVFVEGHLNFYFFRLIVLANENCSSIFLLQLSVFIWCKI